MAGKALVAEFDILHKSDSRAAKTMVPITAHIARCCRTSPVASVTLHGTFRYQVLNGSRKSWLVKLIFKTCHVVYNEAFPVEIEFFLSVVGDKWSNKVLALQFAEIAFFFLRIVYLDKSWKRAVVKYEGSIADWRVRVQIQSIWGLARGKSALNRIRRHAHAAGGR